MRILYITTIGGTMTFFKNFIKVLLENGHTVDIATNEMITKVPDCYREWGCNVFQLSCNRSPFTKANIDAVQQIRSVVAKGGYDIVHCHTPIAAACTRIACKKLRKNGLKVFYTAHGFHFYKGAPLKNWVIYYTIEKICARWTDVLITINKEDYECAEKKLKAKKIEYVPGVGIDVDKFANAVADRATKRQEIGVPEDAFMLISVGELNENKNHQIVIKALSELGDPSVHYVIAGKGGKKDELELLAKKLNVNLHLLGYRTDVAELYKVADVDVFPSIREGLGLSAIEGMASGLPLICSNNRGSRDYANEENAIVCPTTDSGAFANAIETLKNDDAKRKSLGCNGKASANKYNVEEINRCMLRIYNDSTKN